MWDFIFDCIRSLRDWVCHVIQGVIDWLQDVLAWFKKLRLDPRKHTPFVMKGQEFRKMLHQAPIQNAGIFQAVYDEQADEISYKQELQGDALDNETRRILNSSEDGLVVIS